MGQMESMGPTPMEPQRSIEGFNLPNPSLLLSR